MPAVANLAIQELPALAKGMRQLLSSFSQMSTSSNTSSTRGGNTQKRSKPGKKQKRQQQITSPPYTGQPSRQIRGENSLVLRSTFKDVYTVVNGSTAGVSSLAITLGIATTTPTTTLGATVPRMATMAGLYRQYKLNSVTVRFIPFQAYTTNGSVCIGVDQAPTAVAPSGLSNVYHHNPSVLTDIKQAATLRWTSARDMKNAPRYTYASGPDEDEVTYAVLQLYSANSLAAATEVGVLEFIVDVTFMSPA
jgi:hypothetical protein